MAMEINSVYGNYAGAYTNPKETKQVKSSKPTNEADKTEGQASFVGNTKQNESVRKTAADELAYLSKKNDGITFVVANFQPGMKYGTSATTNIAISPEFLKKMASDSKLEAEYEEKFSQMTKLDEQFVAEQHAMGRKVVAQGWAIDKNGGMSGWCILENEDKRHYGQEMTDYANKIRKEKAERRKEQEKITAKKEEVAEKKEVLEKKRKADKEKQADLKEKIDSDNRNLLGDKYKGSEWYDVSDDIFTGDSTKILRDDAVGINLDMKL